MARFVTGGMSVPGTSQTWGPYERGDAYSFAIWGTISKVYFIIQANAAGGGPSVGDVYSVEMWDSTHTNLLNSTTWTADGTSGEKSVSVNWTVSGSTTYLFDVKNTTTGTGEYREPYTASDSLQGTTVNGITRVASAAYSTPSVGVSPSSTSDWYTDVEYNPLGVQVVSFKTGVGSGTPVAPSFATTPVAGNKLLVWVGAYSSNSSQPTFGTASGWTRDDTPTIIKGGTNSFWGEVALYHKDAVGGDSAPSPAFTGTRWAWVTMELAGVTTGAVDGITLDAGTGGSGTSVTPTLNGLTTSNANEYLLACMFVYNSLGTGTFTNTWGGGFTEIITPMDSGFGTTNLQRMGVAAQAVTSTGTYTPTLTSANTGGAQRVVVGTTLALRPSTTPPGGGGGSFSGDSSLSVTATLSASGSVTKVGNASLSTTATLSSSGSVTRVGNASLSVTASSAAAGSVSKVGDSSLSVTVTTSAAGSVSLGGAASLAATVTSTASGAVTKVGNASLAVTASTSSSASVAGGNLTVVDNGDGTLTLSGTGQVDNGDGTLTLNSAGVTDNGDGTLTLTTTSINGDSSLPVTATLSASGVVVELAGASLPVTATLSASGSVGGANDSALAVTVTTSASGSVAKIGAATLPVTVTSSASGTLGESTGSALAVSVTLAAAGAVSLSKGAALPVTATTTAAGSVSSTGAASVAVTVTAVAAGAVTTSAGGSLPVTVTASATGALSATGSASQSIVVTLSASGTAVSASRYGDLDITVEIGQDAWSSSVTSKDIWSAAIDGTSNWTTEVGDSGF